MTDSTFKITIGNPKKTGIMGLSKSPDGSPLVGGLEAGNGSNILFDVAGNIFQEATKNLFRRGKDLFENLDNANIIIGDTYTLNCLSIALSAIESMFVHTNDFTVSAKTVDIIADTTGAILAPTIYLGKVNTDILTAHSDGELYGTDEELYLENSNPDELVTYRKLKKMWLYYAGLLREELQSLEVKYNSHTHNYMVTPPEENNQVLDHTKSDKFVSGINNLSVSKTTKAV